jgi:hypothetical protein
MHPAAQSAIQLSLGNRESTIILKYFSQYGSNDILAGTHYFSAYFTNHDFIPCDWSKASTSIAEGG